MKSVGKRGFSLIEVMVAMFILIIIIASVMMLLSSSYTSLKESEAKNIAKNIATYTLEFIRSRNVNLDNNFILTTDWFEVTSNPSGKFPGLVDLWNEPLMSNGDASKSINTNPALPDDTYQDEPKAFYYSLQGYVSIGDFDYLSASNPSPEDANLKICSESTKHYHDVATDNKIVLRFPINSTKDNGTKANPEAIVNFSPGANYIPYVYSSDANKTNPNNSEYNPHYTSDANKKSKTINYNGFRVLTTIVARRKSDSEPNHVQYYDVRVAVLWVTGGKEHEYSLASQIVTY